VGINLFKVTLKNHDQETVITKTFDTQQEAFNWAVSHKNDDGGYYDIKEEND
jgi:hypothetical protein